MPGDKSVSLMLIKTSLASFHVAVSKNKMFFSAAFSQPFHINRLLVFSSFLFLFSFAPREIIVQVFFEDQITHWMFTRRAFYIILAARFDSTPFSFPPFSFHASQTFFPFDNFDFDNNSRPKFTHHFFHLSLLSLTFLPRMSIIKIVKFTVNPSTPLESINFEFITATQLKYKKMIEKSSSLHNNFVASRVTHFWTSLELSSFFSRHTRCRFYVYVQG